MTPREIDRRLAALEQHQRIKKDDYHMVGRLGRLQTDTISEWLIMKDIVDAEYQRVKAGGIEESEEALCARIMEAISQSKKIPAPGECLVMEFAAN